MRKKEKSRQHNTLTVLSGPSCQKIRAANLMPATAQQQQRKQQQQEGRLDLVGSKLSPSNELMRQTG